MGDVGTQTQGLVPLSHGTFVFISTIKNEHASTQCCLPVTSDASTSTDELANYLKPFIGKKCYSVLSSGGKRRGRPRKRNIMTEGTAKHEAASDISEVAKVKNTDEFVHSRVKRERKIPVKFDPSDVNKTKSTSIPASEFKIKCENEDVEHIDENFKFPESDSDWSDEDISKSKAYDSNDDDVESCLQVSNGTNKKCFTMKYLQNSGVEEDEVFHVESAKDDVGECKNARNGVMEKICIASNNINAQGNALGVTLQTYRKKRTLNHPGRKRRARRKQSGGGPYTCEQCHIDFKLISIYTKHMLNHEISQGKHAVTCKVCGKVLSSHVNLRRHMMIHTGKPFTCQICDKGFTGRYLLKEHLIVEHNQITSNTQTQTNHQCHACKKYMSTKTALQYHLSQLHSCEKCEKKWPCRTSLREHVLQVHDHVNVTKEGRLECFQCNKTFSYRHHYLNHVAHHSDDKKHECLKCKKGFLTSQALYCHTKQVHEKYNFRYPCTVCEKVFICNAKLVEHVRTHTGEKPFVCDMCGVAFAAKATYISHVKMVHHQTPKQKLWKKSKKVPVLHTYNCPLCDIENLKARELEEHCWSIHNATVQFSYEVPEKLQDQDTVVVDDSKNIVFSKGNKCSVALEGSKEIVVSEGSTEIVVSGGSSEILFPEGSTEIVVSEEHTDVQLFVSKENRI